MRSQGAGAMTTRTSTNFWLDVVSLAVMTGLAATGGLIRFVLTAGSGHFHELFGWNRHDIGQLHFDLAVAAIALLALHVLLHWSWICCFARPRRWAARPRLGARSSHGAARCCSASRSSSSADSGGHRAWFGQHPLTRGEQAAELMPAGHRCGSFFPLAPRKRQARPRWWTRRRAFRHPRRFKAICRRGDDLASGQPQAVAVRATAGGLENGPTHAGRALVRRYKPRLPSPGGSLRSTRQVHGQQELASSSPALRSEHTAGVQATGW